MRNNRGGGSFAACQQQSQCLWIDLYAVRSRAEGTTISTSPVATLYTKPAISHVAGNAGIARRAATSAATAARGSLTAFCLSSPSCI